MALEKTTELINSCEAAFKRSGLLRLAEPAGARSSIAVKHSAISGYEPAWDRTTNVRSQLDSLVQRDVTQIGGGSQIGGTSHLGGISHLGAAALDLKSQADIYERAAEATNAGVVRPLGISAVDAILPSGGLPTGKVIELSLSGGAACGTQVALWACRAAQQQAQLNGADSWCAFIDPTASLHAPGVLSSGVSLPRLLVLRPALEDVERVALRLSEANVFSVIIIDLVGVPWLHARATRSAVTSSAATRASTVGAVGSDLKLSAKRENWNRTVRQLALRLEHTQAQVIVLSNADSHRSLPLPVALRLQLRADARGVNLQVVKESQGRVGAQGTVPWSAWGHELPSSERIQESAPSSQRGLSQRAKALPLPRYDESNADKPAYSGRSAHTSERHGHETEIPIVTSSRLARTSRASL